MKNIINLENNIIRVIVLILINTLNLISQEDKQFNFTQKAYIDMYYVTDNDINNTIIKDIRKNFSALNVIENEFEINMINLYFNGSNDNYRFNISLNYGDLSNYAYSSTKLANIQEANAGLRIADDLWFDAGLFLTHIGSESVMPKDNWFSTHAIITNFEPFFQEGIRLSYNVNNSLQTQLMILNGYNIYEDNNQNKTIGYYVKYQLDSNLFCSLAGELGNDQPTGQKGILRVYNNFIIGYKISNYVDSKLTIDYNSEGQNQLFGVFYSMRSNISDNLSTSMRLEYFDDNNGILTKFKKPNDFSETPDIFGLSKMYGFTLSLEYNPIKNSYFRIESRFLNSNAQENKYFLNKSNELKNERVELIMNFGLFLN